MTAAHPTANSEHVPSVSYLTIEDVLSIVVAVDPTASAAGIRDMGLLMNAVQRPSLVFEGRDVYPSMPAKAAALLESIAGHAPLTSGNERLAWLTMNVFLELNRVAVEFEDHETVTLLREVSRRVVSTDELTARLAHRMGPWPPPPPGSRRSSPRRSARSHPRRPGQSRLP